MRSFSGQQAERAGASALPFSDFLDLLRSKGLGVGLHEYLAVGKLLARWDSTNPDDFRDAVAALVGRHEGEVQAIRDLFDEVYPRTIDEEQEEERKPVAPPREYTWVRVLTSRRTWAVLTCALAIAFATALARRYYSTITFPPLPAAPMLVRTGPQVPAPPQVQDPAPEQLPFPDSLVQAPPDPEPAQIEPPPAQLDWRLIAALSAAVLTVSVAGFWGARIRAGARHWTMDAWQAALASLPGPYHARLILKDLVTRLPRNDIEDAATLLARAFSTVSRGRELDVGRSLKETLRAGLRPALIYRPRRVQQTVLVLQDVAQTMAVHAGRVESLLADLRRQGVIFERWYFDGDISLAMFRRNGPPIPLEALARRREDWPLLVISSGLEVPATTTLPNRGWINALRTWTRRVWLSPIQDPHLWPAALRRLPIKVVPMTRGGLMQAAAILAQGEYGTGGMRDRSLETPAPVTIAHVEKLKRLASVVPNPTIPELQLLRQRFAPDVPERAVMHLAGDLETHAGAPLRMSDGDIRQYLRHLRSEAPALELDVRRYLLKILADSEPVPGSAAHLRWQASKAIHEVRIAELTSSDTGPALAALAAVAKGPMWREIREAMERLAPAAEHSPEVRNAAGLAGDARQPPAFRDLTGTLHLQPFYWRAPRWQHVAAAVAITLIAAAAASVTDAFRVQASHALDAYILTYRLSAVSPDGGELSISPRNRNAGLPQRVWLYRDSAPWVQQTLPPDRALTVSIPDEPHIYQVRSELPGGAWALSNTLWAPSVLILIDAQPWARVTVRSPAGRIPPVIETTPAAFRLPPGPYQLSLENGDVTGPLTAQIQVSSTGQRSFQYMMPNFNPTQALDELGLSEPPPTTQYRQ